MKRSSKSTLGENAEICVLSAYKPGLRVNVWNNSDYSTIALLNNSLTSWFKRMIFVEGIYQLTSSDANEIHKAI
jgi:hypothetical protein